MTYTIAYSPEDLKTWVRRFLDDEALPTLALDTETDGLSHDRKVVGVSIAADGHEPMYVPIGHRPKPDLFTLNDPTVNVSAAAVSDVLNELLPKLPWRVVFHNAKFDLQTLRNFGVIPPTQFHDTMILSWLLDPERADGHGLDSLLQQYCGARKLAKPWLVRNKPIPIPQVSVLQMAPYASQDVALLPKLLNILLARLEERGPKALREYKELEIPIVTVLADMEAAGVCVSKELLARYDKELEQLESSAIQEVADALGCHVRDLKLSSTKWLSAVFVDDRKWWGLPLNARRNANGDWTIDKGFLQALEDGDLETTPEGAAVAAAILRWRKYQKLRATYVQSLLERVDSASRVHCNFKQHGTATGRLSSSDPNLQNIPRTPKEGAGIPDLRAVFVAPPKHHLIVADYSQIELRLLAHFSKDDRMVKAFLAGEDLHAKTAEEMTAAGLPTTRTEAKVINFGVAYGMQARRLASTLNISTSLVDPNSPLCALDKALPVEIVQSADLGGATTLRAARDKFGAMSSQYRGVLDRVARGVAQKLLDKHAEVHPGVHQLARDCIEFAREHTYIYTLAGRRRLLRDINAPDKYVQDEATGERVNVGRQARKFAERAALNTLIQGSAADIVKIAMRRCVAVSEGRYRLLSQVHDELVFEVPHEHLDWALRIIKDTMEGAAVLGVPLIVDPGFGQTWSDAK